MTLTPKQIRFCEEYVIDLNASQAAIRAGYGRKSARVTGARLLSRPNVIERIRALTETLTEKLGINAERVLQELCRIAYFDVRELIRHDGSLKAIHELNAHTARAIAGIEFLEHGANYCVKKVKIADKLGALELLAKHLGIISDKLKLSSDSNPMDRIVLFLPDDGRDPEVTKQLLIANDHQCSLSELEFSERNG